jgi:hypothetical protein
MARRTTPSRRSLVSLLVVGMLSILALGVIPRASADGDIGITVNVEVLGPSDSASATATSTATGTGRPTGGTSATASSGTSTSGTPTASISTTPDGQTSIGGILYVSGLTIHYTPSINPLDGKVDMLFTVRNTYKKPIEGKTVFWVTNWLGGTIGHEVTVNVNVKAGETETVTATIRGVGQWGVITGHATYTPPKFLDAITLTAVTRSMVVVYPPWFPISVVSGGCAIWWGWRRRAAGALRDMFAGVGGRG